MGKPTGFMDYKRKTSAETAPGERIQNFNEFHEHLPREEQQLQGARCMECGVPFCQSGTMLAGMASGCPLHNLVPEWNDLVYSGNWEQAYNRLKKTNNFPEFTSRVCPALCEAACTCGLYGEPVATKENEYAVIENAYLSGLAAVNPPKVRTGKRVAVVGSGPSGLAAADQLNRRGHSVTVFERSDRIGGLLMYGIPNMKLEKAVIERKKKIMEEEGITFVVNTDVGKDVKAEKLLRDFDRVILACGASNPRDLNVPGRDAKGICFAVDFLKANTKSLLDGAAQEGGVPAAAQGSDPAAAQYPAQDVNGTVHGSGLALRPYPARSGSGAAKDKHVVIIGGGDTGNDCVGTAIRHGCQSVTQIEMLPEAPKVRSKDNPWPQWPRISKTDYGQEEAIAVFGHDPRIYEATVKEFVKDEGGNLKAVKIVKLSWEKNPENGRMAMKEVPGSEQLLDADLVLIAAGFLGSQKYVTDAFSVELDERTNVKTASGSCRTNVDKVFVTGDMRRGQSLVVWAIREGRETAYEVDQSLLGYSNLMVQ
ncbi:MAG: glutamate synthase subunit beta [Clostridium sp.]|jgi:glutamate synthase (NADPH/NADH) small chain|nr:glutamate synthase subunit beta [Clostridium sp.]